MSNTRTNYIDFKLLRSGRFTPNEVAVLTIIFSYSEYSKLTYAEIGKMLNRSATTIKRTVKSLVEKGIITKTYTLFKKCVLKIVSLQEQAKLLTASGIVQQVLKVVSAKKNKHESNNKSFDFKNLLPSMPKPKSNFQMKTELYKTLYQEFEPSGF